VAVSIAVILISFLSKVSSVDGAVTQQQAELRAAHGLFYKIFSALGSAADFGALARIELSLGQVSVAGTCD
jgi:hypothetical protein